jgi:cytochrome c-type biogenesis protein
MMEVGLLAAFAAGLVSFLSPCVLPLVPAYLAFIAGSSLDELTRKERGPATAVAVRRSLAFVAGFAVVFVAFGASASAVGGFLLDNMVIFSQIAGILIVALGLHMMGAFRSFLLMRDTRWEVRSRPTSLLGAFVVGLAFAFGWSPCVGPVLASILMVAGYEGTVGRGALLLGVYAAGIGLPFILAALFTGAFMRAMARIRRHLGKVEKGMGAALVVTGALIFTGYMPILANWLVDAVPIFSRLG